MAQGPAAAATNWAATLYDEGVGTSPLSSVGFADKPQGPRQPLSKPAPKGAPEPLPVSARPKSSGSSTGHAMNPCAGSAPLSVSVEVDVPAAMASLEIYSGVMC
jgi:hypothetical protein